MLGRRWGSDAVIREYFQGLTDPRIARAQRHNLLDIVASAADYLPAVKGNQGPLYAACRMLSAQWKAGKPWTVAGKSVKAIAGGKSANAGSSPTGRNWPVLTLPGSVPN